MSHGGYISGMQTDTESARLSNVQPYKFNQQARNGSNPKLTNIRKINPGPGGRQLAPISRGSGAGIGSGLHAAKKSEYHTEDRRGLAAANTIDVPGNGGGGTAVGAENYLSGGG